MLVVGISLIFTSVLIKIIMGNFLLVNITIILLYLGCIGFDFVDLLKALRIDSII
jgi:hypothetical protein